MNPDVNVSDAVLRFCTLAPDRTVIDTGASKITSSELGCLVDHLK
jgi:hypothetical protein